MAGVALRQESRDPAAGIAGLRACPAALGERSAQIAFVPLRALRSLELEGPGGLGIWAEALEALRNPPLALLPALAKRIVEAQMMAR